MKIESQFLDELARGHDKVLVFDCEFWHVYENKGFIPLLNKPNEFLMPREIGGFLLTRSTDGQWIYRKNFFVTMSQPKGKDVSFVSSMFANVTQQTADELDKYQSIIGVPWASAYLNTVPEDMQEILLDAIDLYNTDPIVKTAHKPPSWYKTFLKEYGDSLIIVKGTNDIDALQNACKFYDIPYQAPKSVYDIAEWNLTSRKKCGTAKLEGTYNCIVDKLPSDIKQFTKILPIGEAHDPSSDAAMTLIVALYILSIRNETR